MKNPYQPIRYLLVEAAEDVVLLLVLRQWVRSADPVAHGCHTEPEKQQADWLNKVMTSQQQPTITS